jgi:thiol-disulfide isomerase/thioredoxin
MACRIPSIVVLLAFAVFSTAACAADKFVGESDLRQGLQIDPSVKLYFRASDGTRISEQAFLARINRGEKYWWSSPYNGNLALTLGSGPNLAMPPNHRLSKLSPGERVPSFNGVALDGEPVSTATFANKVTLIDFFAVYCGHCIDEMPMLNAFKAEHPDIQTIAVTFDPAPYVGDLVQKQHFTWKVVPDALPVFSDWGLYFTPTFALIDQNGRMIDMALGSMMTPKGQQSTEGDLATWVGRHVPISLKQ